MIEYAKFLVKRTLSRKSNIYLILASIIVLLFILVMNIRNQDMLVTSFTELIETNNTEIDAYSEKLSALEKNSEEYIRHENHIQFLQSNNQSYNKMIEDYNKEDWNSFYKEYKMNLQQELQITENSMSTAENDTSFNDMTSYSHKQIQYIDYLDAHNLAYENIGFPVIGLSFITYVSGLISPILILLCCIFIITQIFTMDYAKSIDISNLFPIGRKKAFIVKTIVGIGISTLIFILILGITFLISSLINFNTGFQYPIMIQDAATNTWQAIPLTTYLKDWLLLGIVFYAGASFFTYLLSLFIKEEGPLFFTSLCIILGIAYLPMFLPEMTKIAHYLPTTYMNFVSVSTGELAMRYSNMDISFTTGIQILSLFIFVIFILSFIIKCSAIFRKTK